MYTYITSIQIWYLLLIKHKEIFLKQAIDMCVTCCNLLKMKTKLHAEKKKLGVLLCRTHVKQLTNDSRNTEILYLP